MQQHPNLADILKESASKFSFNIAVEELNGDTITYQKLYENCNSLTQLLCKNGIGEGDRIGVLIPKSIDAVKIIFSILNNQTTYVPLDINAPLLRNNAIYNDCTLQALFIDKRIVLDFLSVQQQNVFTEININENISLLIAKEKKQKHTQNLAYIIYTSGSSGIPKGVMHTHTSAYTFVKWSINTFLPKESDRIFSYAPFHFDLSIFDLFVSISAGATLVLSNEKTISNPMLLAQYLSEKRISILYATPSVLSLLVNFGKIEKHYYNALHTILFAGEVFPIIPLKKLKNYLPHSKFYNLYGPTETNVCTWYKIPQIISDDKKEPYPIGKTCNYAQFKIATQSDSTEVSGELLISGNSLMCGYWNDTLKSNAVFEKDTNGVLWYHTGDIVIINSEDDLVYLRRKDRMVKRNGYRIELNEIENNISFNENIAQVAVTAKSINSQTNTIITAHIVWKSDKIESNLELLAFCNNVLPIYMIPDNFEFHENLPKTSTHKIDYNQLTNL